jgi:hypothetical protein
MLAPAKSPLYHTKCKQIANRYPIPKPLTVGQLNTFLTQAGDQLPSPVVRRCLHRQCVTT